MSSNHDPLNTHLLDETDTFLIQMNTTAFVSSYRSFHFGSNLDTWSAAYITWDGLHFI